MLLSGNFKGRRVGLLGLAVTSVILAVFIVRLDWRVFLSAFGSVQISWIFVACAAIIASVAVRAIRWKVISASSSSAFALFWYATVLGYVGNMIYPARAGEALRVVALCRSAKIQPGHAMASAFADRLADVFVLGAVALFVLGVERLGPHSSDVLVVSFFLSAAPILLLLAFVRWGGRLGSFVRVMTTKLPHVFAERVPHWYAQAVEQSSVFQRPRVLIAALVLALLAASVDYLSIWLGMRAMGWFLPPAAAVVVGVLIAMGTLIPAAPGYIGIYQVACVLGLKLYGISEAAALAFSIVLQVTILGVIGVQGIVTLAHYGWRLRKLHEPVFVGNGRNAEKSTPKR